MKCITSIQFTISRNGKQEKLFKGKRGLKQRDLLSPLLFVMTMEYLLRLFKKARTQSRFEYHPQCKKLGMTHLMFADDLIIFCKAKPASLQILMNAFKAFTQCTGLKANMGKSQIVFGGDCTKEKKRMLGTNRIHWRTAPVYILRDANYSKYSLRWNAKH